MSFLSNLFNSTVVREDWTVLTNMEDLKVAEKLSFEKSVVLFKHSVTCGISAAAKHRLEKGYDLALSDCHLFYLDLLKHRDISNEIAARYNVIHQSPQMIILRDGKAVFDASHRQVSLDLLKKQITA